MTAPSLKHPLVLAVYPTNRGLGWAAFEGPFAPFDWGTVEPKADKNRRSLEAVQDLVERLLPETIILEAFEPPAASRGKRIVDLGRELVALAGSYEVDSAIYDRLDIQNCFSHFGVKTRHGIAGAVSRHVPAFLPLLPPPRRQWDGEPRAMAIFNAAALVLTHYAIGSKQLLDDLKA